MDAKMPPDAENTSGVLESSHVLCEIDGVENEPAAEHARMGGVGLWHLCSIFSDGSLPGD